MSGASVFAQDFGALIQRFIDDRGWTHEEVARAVWGAKGADRKGHVSGYINARRGKPSSVTVKGFCEALDIPMSEIDALRVRERAAAAEQAAALDIPLAFLDRMALLFGEDERFPGWAAYEAFLQDKAAHYTRLQSELEALRTSDPRVENRVPAIKDLLAAGEIADAEAALGDLRDTATDQALEGLRQLSAIMALQAEAALLRNDADAAFALYRDAGALFDSIAPLEGARMRFDWAKELYFCGLHNGGAGLGRAIDLWNAALEHTTLAEHPEHWANVQICIGAALSEQGDRLEGEAGAILLVTAVETFESVLEVHTRTRDPQKWAMVLTNLGNTLRHQAERTEGNGGAKLLDRAVAAHQQALQVYSKEEAPILWAAAKNNLGTALSNQGERTVGIAGANLLADAVAAYEASLEVRIYEDLPEEWATTQNNLAIALKERGLRVDGPEGEELLLRAIETYTMVLRVHTRDTKPKFWADTQNNLAVALFDQGLRTGGSAGLDSLNRSIEAYHLALEVRTRTDHPVNWAETHENLAESMLAIAALRTGMERMGALANALVTVEGALEVFDPAHMSRHHAQASKLRERILEEMSRKTED